MAIVMLLKHIALVLTLTELGQERLRDGLAAHGWQCLRFAASGWQCRAFGFFQGSLLRYCLHEANFSLSRLMPRPLDIVGIVFVDPRDTRALSKTVPFVQMYQF